MKNPLFAYTLNLVCPGLGHLYSGSWKPGILFLSASLGAAAVVLIPVAVLFVKLYHDALTEQEIIISPLLIGLTACCIPGGILFLLILYVWSVLDFRRRTR